MKITQPGEGYRGVEGKIGYLLRQAAHITRLRIDRALRELPMTHPQFAVLKAIGLCLASHAADIARICMLSPQAVNLIIINLEKAKLVTRTPHKVHGRVLEVSVTALGKKRIEQCRRLVKVIEADMLKNLKPAEEKLIRKWLVNCATEQDR